MEKDKILHIVHTVTSPYNEKMFYKQVQDILKDKIWNDLIKDEMYGIEVTITMHTLTKNKE